MIDFDEHMNEYRINIFNQGIVCYCISKAFMKKIIFLFFIFKINIFYCFRC